MPNYYSWMMETLAPHVTGRVIEYGAGTGTMSERIAPLADQLILIEPSSNLSEFLRVRFANNQKVEVVCENLEAHVARQPANSVRTVVLVNVLEHIEDDRSVLSRLFHIVEPGGHLLLFVPALQALMSKLDLIHGHFRRYHKLELMTKVTAAGGNVLTCRYFDLVGIIPWLLLNKFFGNTTFSPTLVHINDRIIVPISRFIEWIIEPPIGKNLILVASKGATGSSS
jgi:phospholipid N-methyltransferase